MSEDTALLQSALAWIDQDPDATTRAELAELVDRVEKGDEQGHHELSSRFAGHLTFGTAGLRAEIGAGPMRMNRVVVSHAAKGLGEYLLSTLPDTALHVVVGYDARINSDVFAEDTAEILQAMGIQVSLCDQMVPTPVLAFSLRHLGADAGVMVTASHNPPADNGYKVYLGGADEGSQIVPPADQLIHQHIMASHEANQASRLPRSRDYAHVGRELVDAYVSRTLAVLDSAPRASRASLRVCYTPLHGVGGEVFTELLTRAGFDNVIPVAAQMEPDGSFSTVSFPNPEEPGALDLAIETAEREDADLIIANDPDADRLAVCLPRRESHTWEMLTGNELGAILAWSAGAKAAKQGSTGVIGYSLVSSPIAGVIASHFGLEGRETPTGFKWISRIPGLIFGYEEALGYLVNPETVRDKDGMSAGLVLADIATSWHERGLTLWDALEQVRAEVGAFSSAQVSLRFDTPETAQALMALIRKNPEAVFPGLPVHSITDLLQGSESMPPSDILRFDLDGGDRLIVRPSGTEPKLKVYLDCLRPSQDQAEWAVAELEQVVSTRFDELVQNLG